MVMPFEDHVSPFKCDNSLPRGTGKTKSVNLPSHVVYVLVLVHLGVIGHSAQVLALLKEEGCLVVQRRLKKVIGQIWVDRIGTYV